MSNNHNSLPTPQDIQESVSHSVAPTKIRHRRAYLIFIYITITTTLFGILSFFAKSLPYFSFDLPITLTIQSINSPPISFILHTISFPGYSPQIAIITSIILLMFFLSGFKFESLTATANAIITSATGVLLKNLIHRSRPPIELVQVAKHLPDFSFPSGHVLFYTSFFGFIFFLVFVLFKKSLLQFLALILLALLILLIAPSRIFLGQHWASDTIGSYLLGSVLLLITIVFYNWGKNRYLIRQPIAPH